MNRETNREVDKETNREMSIERSNRIIENLTKMQINK